MSTGILLLTVLVGLAALTTINAQQPPTDPSSETILKLPVQQCSAGGSCSTTSYQLVLDADYRGAANCPSPGTDTSAEPCVLYTSNYAGITVSESSASVTFENQRMYLLDTNNQYKLFNLLGQEFSFTVDTSQLNCGDLGALYFVGMQASGTTSGRNTAGAQWGTGYCDAQCLSTKYIDGYYTNGQSGGACCSEMDIWEANREANALTAHSCGSYQDCGLSGDQSCSSIQNGGSCDHNGCQVNPYRNNPSFYGPSSSDLVDSSQPFTVVTQFFTDSSNTLTSIQRYYVQNNVVIGSPQNITSCSYSLATFGQELAAGMVLVLSSYNGYFSWLDVSPNGPCTTDNGNSNTVTFSNIKVGPIGTTSGSPTTPVTSPPATTQSAPTATTPAPTATTPAPAPTTTTTPPSSCPQFQVLNLASQGNTYSTGAEWQFQIKNTGSSTPNSVIVAISVPSGDRVSNPGNMQSIGNNQFSVNNPSSFTASSTEGYSFEVDRPANSANPTPVVTVYSCS